MKSAEGKKKVAVEQTERGWSYKPSVGAKQSLVDVVERFVGWFELLRPEEQKQAGGEALYQLAQSALDKAHGRKQRQDRKRGRK